MLGCCCDVCKSKRFQDTCDLSKFYLHPSATIKVSIFCPAMNSILLEISHIIYYVLSLSLRFAVSFDKIAKSLQFFKKFHDSCWRSYFHLLTCRMWRTKISTFTHCTPKIQTLSILQKIDFIIFFFFFFVFVYTKDLSGSVDALWCWIILKSLLSKPDSL